MDAKQLAAAIRKGHTMIGETTNLFLKNGCGCALGAAWVGSGKTEKERFALGVAASPEFARHMGIETQLASEISRKHFRGMPRLAIADWLDTLEPTQRQTFDSFLAATLKSVELERA